MSQIRLQINWLRPDCEVFDMFSVMECWMNSLNGQRLNTPWVACYIESGGAKPKAKNTHR